MRRVRMVLLTAALAGTALLGVSVLWGQMGTPGPSAAGPNVMTTMPQVSSRTAFIDNVEVGEVLVGETVVFRIREAAGGYTAPQRASMVANRLATYLGQGYAWHDIQVGMFNNQQALLMGNNLLITADTRVARANDTTPLMLAYMWQDNAQTALQSAMVASSPPVTTLPATTTTAVAGTQESWPDWTNTDTRIVPIISLGTPGLRLGFAQVAGPTNRVNAVRSVIQLDLVFQRTARVRVFVPSSTLTGLNRVQGVAVSALLQYQLVRF